jgi:polysaccharide biosynthesis/export protein
MHTFERKFRKVALVAALALVAAVGCARQEAGVDRINAAALETAPATDRTEQFAAAINRWQQTLAGQEYRLGAGDVVETQIYELEDLEKSQTLTFQIGSSGEIRFPLIGTVKASGLTVGDLRTTLETRLAADYMVDPQVSVSVKEYHSRQVTVTGAVQKPGVYALSRNSVTLLDALALAGCLTDRAGPSIVVRHCVPPAAPMTDGLMTIDVAALLDQGRLDQNLAVSDGDVIHVPEASQFYVSGFVEKPGAFLLRRPTTLLEAIATAGGMKDTASPEAVHLIRVRDGRQETLTIDLDNVVAGRSADLPIGPNDKIVIGQTQEKKFWTGVGEAMTRVFSVGFSMGTL